MANNRFKDKPQVGAIQDNDAGILQEASSNDDKHWTWSQAATYIKVKIGDATQSISGFFSAADKTKLDSFPNTAAANQTLNTDGLGAKVWEAKTAGDMVKTDYDSNADNKVDAADEADDIAGTPGNNFSYGTNGAGAKSFLANSSLTVGLATNIEGTPGNSQVYGTNAAGAKGFRGEASLIVAEAELARGLNNSKAREWSGQTSDGSFTEIFLLGIASDRFPLADADLYGFEISIVGSKDDNTGAFYGRRMGIIQRTGSTTALVGAIQTIGTDIVVGVTPDILITADDGNETLKVEVKGVAAETWNWRAAAILTKST